MENHIKNKLIEFADLMAGIEDTIRKSWFRGAEIVFHLHVHVDDTSIKVDIDDQ